MKKIHCTMRHQRPGKLTMGSGKFKAVHKCLLIAIFATVLLNGCGKKAEDHLLLNGKWRFCIDPPLEFTPGTSSALRWSDIVVPGECQMQGYPIKHENPFIYELTFMVPPDFKKKDILLCFDGVYSFARVWVNGNYLRDHTGGFTAWDCNITPYVTPGDSATITVECTDKRNDPSYASGYAKHQIGGILRDVYLRALPKERIRTFYVETIFDSAYNNAKLRINFEFDMNLESILKVRLTDPDGRNTFLNGNQIKLAASEKQKQIEYEITNPVKWDSEHPFLYTLTLELTRKGKTLHVLTEKVGFRTVTINGNQILINGDPVKLRGACRHDVDPLLGRSASPGYDLRDALLARESNINFIRTSHYPPTKRFADLCDSLGIYLEVENAACFMRTSRLPEYDTVIHSGPGFDESLNRQLKEMVQTFRNNPSVIIWSLGNESKYEDTFLHGYEYLKSVDPNRPVIFSYPGTVPEGIKCFDILSIHYPKYSGSVTDKDFTISDFINDTIPVLYDEWAHVACYNKPVLQSDVNVREFWGRSLDSMWINCYNTKSALGGAIWGMIDETFMMPDKMEGFNQWWGINQEDTKIKYESRAIGYGEWGIIDVWRRKKPEFWSVLKAYSPVRIATTGISEFKTGEPLKVEVCNRFNHTSLSEITGEWSYNGTPGKFTCPGIEPGQCGFLEIPGQPWEAGTRLELSFRDRNSMLIDRYLISIGESGDNNTTSGNEGSASPVISENGSAIRVTGEKWYIDFSKKTGLVTAAVLNGDTIIRGGPYLNYTVTGELLAFTTPEHVAVAQDWKLLNLTAGNEANEAVVRITGTHGNAFKIYYTLRISSNGVLKTGYSFDRPIDNHLVELGIRYHVKSSFDKLRWKRDSYWTSYPDDHLGRPEGEVRLRELYNEKYRTSPEKIWERDVCNFYYRGVENKLYPYNIPNEVSAMKENISLYSLDDSSSGNSLIIISDGSLGCRLFQDTPEQITLIANNLWDYPDLLWGNYMKMIKVQETVNYEVVIQFMQN